MILVHDYKGMGYQTAPVGDLFQALIRDVPVIGTTSKSRGEASMRFTLMVDQMMDMEAKPMEAGDLVTRLDGKQYMIRAITSLGIYLREGAGDGDTNFRGPYSAEDNNSESALFRLDGILTFENVIKTEWDGIADVEFRAYKDEYPNEGVFKYVREVNCWKEVESEI